MKKIAVFGGSFNPPHQGHINSAQVIQRLLGFAKFIVVPTGENPLKPMTDGPTDAERLEMTKLAFQGLGSKFVIDAQEIERKGPSYTFETLKNIAKTEVDADLHFVIGLDQLKTFGLWKNPEKIVQIANLVVTSRPDFTVPKTIEDLPTWFQEQAEKFEFNRVYFHSGKYMQFVQLPDVEVSSTEVRKALRSKKSVGHYIPLALENYIKEKKLYQPIDHQIRDYREMTRFIAKVLDEKKAIQVRSFDLSKASAPSEFAIVGSGTSTRHAVSLSENLVKEVKEEFGVWPQSVEGLTEGRWVLVDYGNLIVHIFYDFVRQEYSIEKLWIGAQAL